MNIAILEGFIEQENNWRKIFKSKPLSLLSHEDRQEIADILDSKLSPENLTCDGELSATEVRNRYRFYTRCVEELRSIDPEVTLYEY